MIECEGDSRIKRIVRELYAFLRKATVESQRGEGFAFFLLLQLDQSNRLGGGAVAEKRRILSE
jgi:hypothetical protein